MNNKGFTLTELLVTIALIGIVTMIAFPAITKLKSENEDEKYEAYANVLKAGAKLYVDANEDDLWTNSTSYQCKKIKYSELKNQNLVKEYNNNGITCNDSYIVVEKNIQTYGNSVKYTTVTICRKNGKEIYRSSNKNC